MKLQHQRGHDTEPLCPSSSAGAFAERIMERHLLDHAAHWPGRGGQGLLGFSSGVEKEALMLFPGASPRRMCAQEISSTVTFLTSEFCKA